MKKHLRALFMSLVIRPKMEKTIQLKNTKKYIYRIRLNWYSPFTWLLVAGSLVLSFVRGAIMGFVSTWHDTFKHSGSTGQHTKTLENSEAFKYYMYFN